MKVMALPGRCAGPSRLVSDETWVCCSSYWVDCCSRWLPSKRHVYKRPRADGRREPGRPRSVRPLITRCGRRGGDASEARMCRCAGEQRRAGIGRTADRAKPMRTQVRKASKGLPVPARRRPPQPGPTTARRGIDHALQQARRLCQRGTYVPMRLRAAPRRDVCRFARKKGGRSPPCHLTIAATYPPIVPAMTLNPMAKDSIHLMALTWV